MANGTQIVWLAEARKVNSMYLYIDEVGHANYTPVARLALKFATESGCWAYIEEFDLTKHFKPTAHYFE